LFASSDPELLAGPACKLIKQNESYLAARAQAEVNESRQLLVALEANAASPSEIDKARTRVSSAEAAMQMPSNDLTLRIGALVQEITQRRSQLTALNDNRASPEVIATASSTIQDLRRQLDALVRLAK
jgi:hypothetical protein